MKSSYLVSLLVLIALAAAAVLSFGGSGSRMDPAVAEQLQQHRNLGKAFYENPGTGEQAVEQLRLALELNPTSPRERLNYGLALLRAGKIEEGVAEIEQAQQADPSIPHTYFNLGIEHKKAGEAERAIVEFERMVELVPGEAKAHYNLGQLYKQLDRREEAIAKFELAAKLDPSLAAPRFQLYNLFRRGDRKRALVEINAFKKLKKAQEDIDASEDVNWSFYSELYDAPEAFPAGERAAATRFDAERLGALDAEGRAGLLVLDVNGDQRPDLLAWSSESAVLFVNREGRLEKIDAPVLAEQVRGARHLAAGDWDNDGLPEICVAAESGSGLVRNRDGESFELTASNGPADAEACLFVDFDHDGDLDLLIVGAENRLLRNNGDGTVGEGAFPFAPGKRGLAAATAELIEDNGFDIIIAYEDEVVVYEDRKLGRYERGYTIDGVVPGPAPLRIEVVDLDHDGLLDVALSAARGPTRILRNRDGRLEAGRTIERALAWADLQNRGWTDAVGEKGVRLNEGGFEFADGAADGLPGPALAAAAADFNADGRVDLALLDANRTLHLATNATETANQWASVALTGVKSAKAAQGARVEVKSGRLYRKQVYRGFPLHFGLGAAEEIDTIRITWPNGLIQNETRRKVGEALTIVEKPRLSGSCPMIFTWNGEEFEYISEVLGVAPLGASLGGGAFFPVDHDEYVFIAGERLKPKDGFYEIRITEELRETAYLDQIKLLVVDSPADVEIFTNEKFKAPPFPKFRLFGVREQDKLRPSRASDHRGRDVLARVAARDGRYVDGFKRSFRNQAERHSLTLDFPRLRAEGKVRLFLTGWVDWADASTIVSASQTARNGFAPPVLQVRDSEGRWQTVIEDLGLPGGRPRTMSVDLTGKFLSASREIRIVTNLCVYWDEVFAAEGDLSPVHELRELRPVAAELRFRGFSEWRTHPARTQPEDFLYARVRPTSSWNPTPGMYTAYGDVIELLERVDDRMTVMGAGDELALSFRAPDAPPKPGWKRDFALFVDGWAKENEANTAFGDSVEPLPFHSMSSYPYGEGEAYPRTPEHERYLRKYNVRPALRLIRPLGSRPLGRE